LYVFFSLYFLDPFLWPQKILLYHDVPNRTDNKYQSEKLCMSKWVESKIHFF